MWSQGRIKAGRSVRGAGPCGGYGFLLPESCQEPPAGAAPLRPRIPSSLLPGPRSSRRWDGIPSTSPLLAEGHGANPCSPFKHPSDPEKRCHLLPPAGTVPPGKGREGRDLYNSSSRPDTHSHTRSTHTHTTECNRTQCRTSFTHAVRLCKAHTLQYGRDGAAMAGILYRSQCKQ